MSSLSDALPLAVPHPVEQTESARPRRRAFRGVWWRHGLAILALLWALFPVVFIISAGLNPSGTLSTAELLPKNISLINFDALFSDTARPYLTWYKNSMNHRYFRGSRLGVHRGVCGLRVLQDEVRRPAPWSVRAAVAADVPGAAGLRRAVRDLCGRR